jgi:hypothetical protein
LQAAAVEIGETFLGPLVGDSEAAEIAPELERASEIADQQLRRKTGEGETGRGGEVSHCRSIQQASPMSS